MRGFGTRTALVIATVVMGLLAMAPGFAAGQVEMKLGHVAPTNNPYHLGADFFARRVAELTQGKVNVKVFPDAQLGNEKDLVEGLRLGTLQLAITANAPMSQFFPQVLLFDLPFIFRDNAHWAKVVDGPVGAQITGLFPQKGLRALATFDGGWRSPYNSKRAIAKLEDVKGLKFRTMESPMHISIYRALGAQAVPMGSSEVYSALQQGVVDGGDSPVSFYEQLKHYEVAKQLSDLPLFKLTVFLLASDKVFTALPQNQQAALLQAGKEAAAFERQKNAEVEGALAKKLESAGVKITHVPAAEVDRIVQAMKQTVWKQYEGQVGAQTIEAVVGTR